MSEMLALNIYNTFYGRTGWEGVGQAKAVIFFILVGAIAMIQNRLTRSKEVQQCQTRQTYKRGNILRDHLCDRQYDRCPSQMDKG